MLAIAFCILVSATLMLAGHYMPWRNWIGRDLHRTEAYLWGTFGILIPASIAVLSMDVRAWPYVGMFWLSASAAGLTTIITKGFDNEREHRHQLSDLQDRIDYTHAHNPDAESQS